MKSNFEKCRENRRTYVIAEIGSNHDQDLGQACRLIYLAAEAGADAVKFQLFHPDDFPIQKVGNYSALTAAALPTSFLRNLAGQAEAHKVDLFFSTFALWALERVEAVVDPPLHKVASSEVTNHELLYRMAKIGKPVLLSTGMSSMADIAEAVEILEQRLVEIVLLQCTSVYPVKPEDVHLSVMKTLETAFGYRVGFSDHTLWKLTPALAVAAGAAVIEKHMTIDKKLPGPDHSYALTPGEFKEMVDGIRYAERVMGHPYKRFLDVEKKAGVRRRGFEWQYGPTIGDMQPEGVPPRYRDIVDNAEIDPAQMRAGKPIKWSDLK